MEKTQACAVAVVDDPAAEPKEEKREVGGVVAAENVPCVVIDVDGSDPEVETVCRICHLTSDRGAEGADLIHLGCGCKGELAVAHRHCAEAWFKVKGSRCCEICGANAKNITGVGDSKFMEEWHEGRSEMNNIILSESGLGNRQIFCNILMVCLVAAFILPWLFRANTF